MDDLRHDEDEREERSEPEWGAGEDDVYPDASVDAQVIDRLSAYGHEPFEEADEPTTPPYSGYQPAKAERPVEDEPAVEDESAVSYANEPRSGHDELPLEEEEVEEAEETEPVAAVDPDPVTMEDAALPEEFAVEEDGAEITVSAPVPDTARRFGRRRGSEATAPKETKERGDKRTKKLVGLKIGASQIAAAQVVNNGSPEVVEVFREPLEAGVVVSGEIRDPETLGDALKRFFDLHKLPKRGVRLGLSNNRIGVRIFEIEGVADPQQLENAIRFRAEEVLPIPLDQAVLDYVVLDDEVRADGSEWKRILLVVAYREVVDRYLQACRRAGLQVVGIDLEAFALLRSLEAPTERDSNAGALVAVALGHDRTTIAVSTGRACEFARVLDWGGWSLNVAIARELDRAPSEVESIKRQLSFAHETEVEGLTAEQVAKTRSGIQRALANFTRELVASLQFYQAQPGALGIGEIVLTGGTAHMDGLSEAVGELIGVPVRLGDPFTRVKVGPKVAVDGQSGSMAVAIGLGIED